MNQKKFYVTTPIYYVTAKPHLGSLYSTLLADVAARWYKLNDYKTFFLTGTDEHGQKVAQAAQAAGLDPKRFVDSFIDAYKSMWKSYEIDYTYFIRTTDTAHVQAVQTWIKRLIQKGDIYKAFYEGFYCTPCETFVTEESEITDKNIGPACPSCARSTSLVSEESYFFKLSAYQDKLLEFYETHKDFIVPCERFNEVISFVKSGLKDLSISRTTVKWGIPFPDDNHHVTYVWADALNNYITAIGYGDESRTQEFNFWWPADLQILGKDIVRFHAVYWPAFLMASDLEIPKKLLVHGWLKVNNQKMSKSFGNVVDPQQLLDTYGAEAVRYYLVRHMAITQDSEFSTQDLEQRINSDLANDLGNLLNRMVTLSHKRDLIKVESVNLSEKEIELRNSFITMLENFKIEMELGYYYRALNFLWRFINDVNSYFHAQEPWKVKDADRFKQIISATAHSLHGIAILLMAVLPTKMNLMLESLGIKFDSNIDNIEALSKSWTLKFNLSKIPNLFEKIEPVKNQETEQTMSEQTQQTPAYENINIQDFTKVMLLVGTIEQCEEMPKSDKMLKLQVNFGEFGVRQILSGVKKYFSCQDLLGKQGTFVYNLTPRAMLGTESHGMMLFAQDETGKRLVVSPTEKVPNGTRLE